MLWLVNTALLVGVYYTAAEYVGYLPVTLVALVRLGLSLVDTYPSLDTAECSECGYEFD